MERTYARGQRTGCQGNLTHFLKSEKSVADDTAQAYNAPKMGQ